MDPITGIGLAASVVQLVTLGIQTVQICQELSKQGSVSEYHDLEYTTGHLASLTNSLQQSLKASSPRSSALTRAEKDLLDLGRKCEECSQKLQRELRKLQSQPGASALVVAQKAARAIWKKNSISKIQEQLEDYRATLEIKLLYQLGQQFNAQELKRDKSFASLDKSLQHIITCLANSQTSLAMLMAQQSEQTRHISHISANLNRLERLHIDDRLYEDVTRSLFYSDITSRQEQVDNMFDGIENTYEWIFDDPQSHSTKRRDQLSWDDFSCWLKSGHGVYWISGKAGSGKSTLMNYICNHDRKTQSLKEWYSNRRMLAPTFFFWNAGSNMQKSINGLLRSLLYQMLKECRELVACFQNEPLHAWSDSRLQSTLLKLLRQTRIPIAVCMFIDGLDEFEGRYESVITMMNTLADQTHIKICLSSRPILAFEQAFGGKPGLRLQDLTFGSIRAYANIKLSGLIQQHVSYDAHDRERAEHLLDRIVDRADGVFLWAVIAVRDVRDGLQDIVDMNELAQAIEALPTEMEHLYLLMLDRIKPAYQRDAARFLKFVLYDEETRGIGTLSLFRLYLSNLQHTFEDSPFSFQKIATSELIKACLILRSRLLSHTGGLLELTPSYHSHDMDVETTDDETMDDDPIFFVQVSFVHKSARDFLRNNDEAKSFLALEHSNESHIRLSIAKGALAEGVQIFQPKTGYSVLWIFQAALRQISMAEGHSCAAQSTLMQSLNFNVYMRRLDHIDKRMEKVFHEAYMITESAMESIDLVGLAASEGMTIYPCEQLGLQSSSGDYAPVLPDLKNYTRSRSSCKSLVWSKPIESQISGTDVASRSGSASYRQALGDCLQWQSVDRLDWQTDAQSDPTSLADSYLLSCCSASCYDLVLVLLQAGADPMVTVKPMGKEYAESKHTKSVTLHFWERWLLRLMHCRSKGIKARGRSWSSLLDTDDMDLHTMNKIIDITKALLARGADINHHLGPGSSDACFLKRRDLKDEPVDLILTPSAKFILEECFGKEPEFRKFFDEIEPLVETPLRYIIGVITTGYENFLCPTLEEYKVL